MPQDNVKFGAIYGGAGFPALGALWADLEVVWQIEPRPYFNIKTFRHNFGKVLYSNDAEAFYGNPVDIIWMSPSCGEFSSATRSSANIKSMAQKTFNDFEYTQAILQIKRRRPKIWILENVPSVKTFVRFESSPAGFILKHQITHEVIELFDFYIEEHKITPTEVDVPQVRDRLFTIGSLYPNEFLLTPPEDDKRSTLSTRHIFEDLDERRKKGEILYNDNKPRHSDEKIEKMSRIRVGEGMYGGLNNKRLDPDKPCPVIMSSATKYIHPWADRLYTPREAACLMGVPVDFRFFGRSENSIFDQIGKGIVPQVAEFILKQAKEYLLGL
jgi:site-specific DNA-cytosine methylase